MKNSLNELTEEELLKALEVADKNVTPTTDFNGFINTFNIKNGTNKIPTRVLFTLYRKWSKEPISKNLFMSYMSTAFEVDKAKVGINIEPLAILELIGQSPKKPSLINTSPTYKKHFETYLKKHEMEPGYLFIKFSVLFDVYDKWQYNNKLKTRLSKDTLDEFMNLYFKRRKDDNEVYFGLNPNILNNLTDEQKLQCLSQKSKLNAIKKENQKKSN